MCAYRSRRDYSGSQGSFSFLWVHSGAPSGRPVHPGKREFNRALLEVVGFIGVRIGSLVRAWRSSDSFGFAWVHLEARCDRFYAGSRGFTQARIGVVGLIGVRVGSLKRS